MQITVTEPGIFTINSKKWLYINRYCRHVQIEEYKGMNEIIFIILKLSN